MKYDWNDISSVIRENDERLAVVASEYNPLIGTSYCDEIQRVHVVIEDAPLAVQNIPVEMLDEPLVQELVERGSLAKVAKGIFGGSATERKILDVWKRFARLRCQYDFEFWCATQIKIKLKGKGKRDYFILNRAQRYLLKNMEALRKSNKPIDIILLKARQWGGSTMTQFYMFWIQKMWKTNWNSTICGDVEKQAKVVLAMLENAARDYSSEIDYGRRTELRPYGRDGNLRQIVGRDCVISIGSAENPEKVRGEDISMCHLTEVGVWKATQSKSPEDLIQSLMGAILDTPYSLKVIESTAKGVGNYFHNTWLDAVKGENNFTPVFVPWYLIDLYQRQLRVAPDTFVESMDDYEKWQFDQGASLEAIYWYRTKKKSLKDQSRMMSEFPTSADEAFQSTGSIVFNRKAVDAQYANCCDPIFRGDVIGDFDRGINSMDGVHLVDDPKGNFKIWAHPDLSADLSDRYVVTVDLGVGKSAKADNSIICVVDRYWQQDDDGVPEVVAEWAGHLRMDLLAWKAAQIAHMYDDALLVIESNSLDMHKADFSRAVLDEIKDYYPNLYKRPIKDVTGKVNKDPGDKQAFRYGWFTGPQSKPEIILLLDACLCEGLYYERCRAALDEMKVFERKPDGELGAVEGNHDDRVITRAIAMHFCWKRMPKPSKKTNDKLSNIRTKIVNEYS